MTRLHFHPIAQCWRMLNQSELSDLTADILAHGQIHDIVLFEGLVLDGRNRYLACIAAGVQPRFIDFDGADPIAFVLSANEMRRHDDIAQRALTAGRLANLKVGDNQHTGGSVLGQTLPLLDGVTPPAAPVAPITIARAAELMDVSPASVARAKVVLDHGIPDLVEKVEAGEIPITVAAAIAKQPQEGWRIVRHLCCQSPPPSRPRAASLGCRRATRADIEPHPARRAFPALPPETKYAQETLSSPI